MKYNIGESHSISIRERINSNQYSVLVKLVEFRPTFLSSADQLWLYEWVSRRDR